MWNEDRGLKKTRRSFVRKQWGVILKERENKWQTKEVEETEWSHIKEKRAEEERQPEKMLISGGRERKRRKCERWSGRLWRRQTKKNRSEALGDRATGNTQKTRAHNHPLNASPMISRGASERLCGSAESRRPPGGAASWPTSLDILVRAAGGRETSEETQIPNWILMICTLLLLLISPPKRKRATFKGACVCWMSRACCTITPTH